MLQEVRVRFAPSPTGPLHIGGVRTALFNYLFAKKNNGKFILRIEDTDQTRYVEGAEQYIIDSLKWCGIVFDEDVIKGGKFGPYRQSDRKDIYKKYADLLVGCGNAYYAFDTPDELDKIRKEYEAKKQQFQYDVITRKNLNNSLTLSNEKTEELLRSGVHYVIRFKMPENELVVMNDIIRGKITVNSNALDDKVLFKSDGMPTYHLANIVDDHLMEISHVIRGEEWLPSLPLHVLLYRAFGWEQTMPQFAHLPLILKPDGKGKLSKRDGDKLGFPVFPIDWKSKDNEIYSGYKEWGYFPEAFINMLALLGWNSGTEKEIFDLNELVEIFELERVQKAGARFSPDKTKWFNQQYLNAKPIIEITEQVCTELKNKGISIENYNLEKICTLLRDRATFIKDIANDSLFFFNAPETFDSEAIKKRWKSDTHQILKELINVIESVEHFNTENIENSIKNYFEPKNIGLGQVMTPLRIVVVGNITGPSMIEIIEVLGKNEIIKRINYGLEKIKINK